MHTLSFERIRTLTNCSRDWALMRLEFRVPPDTDLGLVRKPVKSIGKELAEDPEIGPTFIESLKLQEGCRDVSVGAK